MKRWLARLSKQIVLCSSLVLLALPAGASAKENQAQLASFTVAGTNGLTLEVQKMARGTVSLIVSEEIPPVATISATGGISPPNRGTASMTGYLTNGSAGLNSIEADLGTLGKISVAFQPSGKVHVNRLRLKKGKRCNGPRRFVRRLGTFTGTIEFTGEGGYTSVSRTSAPGSIGDFPFTGCYPKIIPPPGFPILEAFEHADRHTFGGVQFTAYGGSRPLFLARKWETAGADHVFVHREVRAVGSEASFRIAGGSLGVDPPLPFSGGAVLRNAGSDSRTWTGDLSVDFPGIGATPLTGPLFRPKKSRWPGTPSPSPGRK